MNPLRTVREAITLPFTAVFVVGLCVAINWWTAPGHWWAQWVALGMGIAVLAAWWRALKLAAAAGVLALLGGYAYRRWGEAGRARVQRLLAAGEPPPPPAR